MQLAIANAGEIDERKVEAQQARRVLDRLVGYKASPVLWKTVKKGISAGRVQTVALRLLVEREREIRAFKPVEYWTVEALLEKDKQQFTAKLHHIDGKKPVIQQRGSRRTRFSSALKSRKTFEVTEVKRRERRKNPGAAVHDEHAAAGSRQEAELRLEADDAPGAGSLRRNRDRRRRRRRSHHLHAHRLDARLADGAPIRRATTCKMMFGKEYLPDAPQLYMDGKAKNAQDAHEAIRPTDPTRRPEHIRKYLKDDQFKLYELIWQRFMASQMAPAVFDTTTVDFDLVEVGAASVSVPRDRQRR